MELKDHEIAPSVAIPAIPPRLFPMPLIDLQIHKIIKKPEMNIPTDLVVQQYLMQEYYSVLRVFTGGSKEPESGRTAAAVCIYTFKIKMAKRLSDHLSVFTTELLAIILALQWTEEVQPERTVICSDSMAALTSLLSGKSEARQDLVFEVLLKLCVCGCVWVCVDVCGCECGTLFFFPQYEPIIAYHTLFLPETRLIETRQRISMGV